MTIAWYLKPCVTAPELLVLRPLGLNPGWVSGTLETTDRSLEISPPALPDLCFTVFHGLNSPQHLLPTLFWNFSATFPHLLCRHGATRTLLVCTKPVHPILSMTDTHANIHIGNIWGDISIGGQVLLYWDRPLPN